MVAQLLGLADVAVSVSAVDCIPWKAVGFIWVSAISILMAYLVYKALQVKC